MKTIKQKNTSKLIESTFDSVNLINKLDVSNLDDEKKIFLKTNLAHLKLMMKNASFVETLNENQKKDIENCISSFEEISVTFLKSNIKPPPIDNGGQTNHYQNSNLNFFKKTPGQRKYETVTKNINLVSDLLRGVKQPSEKFINQIQYILDFTDKIINDPSILEYLITQPILGDPNQIISDLISQQLQLKESFDNIKNPPDKTK